MFNCIDKIEGKLYDKAMKSSNVKEAFGYGLIIGTIQPLKIIVTTGVAVTSIVVGTKIINKIIKL